MKPPRLSIQSAQRLMAPPLLRLLRPLVTGLEHLPAQGPLLLAPNHRSFLDHFLVAAASPRPVYFLGKEELAQGISGKLNLAFGMVPITRGSADREALSAVAQLLEQGNAVVVFPEGTRSPTGELFRFRSGLARLAAASGASTVPVGLIGTADVWPLGATLPKGRPAGGVLQVHFAEPIAAPGESGAARRTFTDVLWQQVAALSGQQTADRFASLPADRDNTPPEQGAVTP